MDIQVQLQTTDEELIKDFTGLTIEEFKEKHKDRIDIKPVLSTSKEGEKGEVTEDVVLLNKADLDGHYKQGRMTKEEYERLLKLGLTHELFLKEKTTRYSEYSTVDYELGCVERFGDSVWKAIEAKKSGF
jgi:hypothetical protein